MNNIFNLTVFIFALLVSPVLTLVVLAIAVTYVVLAVVLNGPSAFEIHLYVARTTACYVYGIIVAINFFIIYL